MRKATKIRAKPIPVRPPLQRGANQALAKLFNKRAEDLKLSVRDLGRRLKMPSTTIYKTLREQLRLDPFKFVEWCVALELGEPIGPAHQSWTPMTILSDPLGRLERFGADVAE